jgi:hypothetical protein
MAATIEISKLAEQLVALHLPENTHQRFAVVVPLAEGRAEVVREFLAEEPPFDPAHLGLEHHHVFVTETEVIFVFETAAGLGNLDRLLEEPDFWDIVEAWDRCASAEPRVAAASYEWPEGARPRAS